MRERKGGCRRDKKLLSLPFPFYKKSPSSGRRDFQTEKQREREEEMWRWNPSAPDDKRRWTMFRCHLHTLSLLYGLQHVKHKSDTYIKHTDTQYWRMTITITTGGERCETTYTHITLLVNVNFPRRRETWKLVPLCLSWTSSALSYFKQNREADCIGDKVTHRYSSQRDMMYLDRDCLYHLGTVFETHYGIISFVCSSASILCNSNNCPIF